MRDTIKILAWAVVVAGLLALAHGVCARGATLYGNIKDVGLTAQVTNITFTPLSTPLPSGSTIFISRPKVVTTAADGGFTNTFNQGDYRVTIGGIAKDSFIVSVADSTNTFNWTGLITNSLTYTYTTPPTYIPRSTLGTRGAILVYDGTNAVELAPGTDGQVLQADSSTATGLKYFTASGLGTVTSVGATSGTAGLTITGSPITGAGVLGFTLDPTVWLTVANAGASNWVSASQVAAQIASSNLVTAAQVGVQIGSSNYVRGVAVTGTGISGATNDGVVTITGAASSETNYVATIQSNGVNIVTGARILNIVNPATLVSNAGATATLTLPTGGGGGTDYIANSGGYGTNTTLRGSSEISGFTLDGGEIQNAANGWFLSDETDHFQLADLASLGTYLRLHRTNAWVEILRLTNSVAGDLTNTVLRWQDTGGTQYNLLGESGDVGWKYDGNWIWKLNGAASPPYNESTWTIRVPEPVATNDVATKAYVDTAVAGGTTNFPHITATNGINIPTNGTLTLYGVGYGDASNYKQGRISQSATSFDIGTFAAGTGAATSNGMPIVFSTWNTNRMIITPSGEVKVSNGLYPVANGVGEIGNASAKFDLIYGYNIKAANIVVGAAGLVAGNTTFSQSGNTGARRLYITGDLSPPPYFSPITQISFSREYSTNLAILATNAIFRIGSATDYNATNPICVFDPFGFTNRLNGTTTITNLILTGINGSTPKSITNTWYSVTADGTGRITNETVYIQGVLTSWKQNGTEL